MNLTQNRNNSILTKSTLFLAALSICSLGLSQGIGSNWSVENETVLGLGHDSNVFGTRESKIDDGFYVLSHEINVARKNSLSSIGFDGNVSSTSFFSEGEGDFVDGGISLFAAYPENPTDVTFWDTNAYWYKNSRLDLDIGRRIQPEVYGALVKGEWLFSPKTSVTGSLGTSYYDRSSEGFSKSRNIRLRTGVSSEWGPEKRWNAEYGYKRGKSGSGTDSEHHALGLRARGRLSAKAKGDVFVGLQKSEYRGGFDFDDTSPVISGNLLWNPTPLLSAKLEIDSDYDFAADGAAKRRNEMTFDIDRDLGKGYKFGASVTRGYSTFERDQNIREDRYWILGMQLEYSFTSRFFARLSADLVTSVSDESASDLNRTLVFIQSGLRY